MYYDFLTEQFQTLHSLDLNDLSAMYRKTAASETAFRENATYKVISMPTFISQSSSLRIQR